MAKRRKVTVRWKYDGWWGWRDGTAGFNYVTRRMAIQQAAHYCREGMKIGGLFELVVYNKGNGRISETRSYGRDPRRYKG